MIKTDYESVIIGGGPAGLTAGIYLSRAKIKTVLIEKMVCGGQIMASDWIENYPGFPNGLSGSDLSSKMLEHAENLGLKTSTTEIVSISKDENEIITLHTADKKITTKTIIIASGASPKKPELQEVERFIGKGISFCATCDAPFCKDKVVVAIGGGDTAVQEAIYLTKFAKKVYLVHRRDELRAVKILRERISKNDKVEILWDSKLSSLEGLMELEKVKVKNLKTNEEKIIETQNCFVWIGIIPNTSFIKNFINLSKEGFIITDENMQTSEKGVYAAGDVRVTPLRQVSTAVGDGAIAAMSVAHYLES